MSSSNSIFAHHLSFLDDILSADFSFSLSHDQYPSRKTNSSSSGSDGTETIQWPETKAMEDRRKKRMISNRESARRSRMRKQKHLENLRNQVTRYKTGNQELMNRLRIVIHNGQLVQRENERLRFESMILQQKLCNLHQLLISPPELHNPLLASACMAMI